jgi:D-alanyl-D-alanine carboxypeptidase
MAMRDFTGDNMAERSTTARYAMGALALFAAMTAHAASTQEAIDTYLSARYPADAPGAAVIVVKDGKVIFRKGYGLADMEMKTPLRPEMVFRLASVTKQFTAVGIVMLAEQGKLALSDDVRRFIPDYPAAAGAVSIERLLNHTAGVPGFSDEYLAKRDMRADVTPAQILEIIKSQPSEFTPGSKWSYSDGGYELLGIVIEKASGMAYADFVEQRIFKPLGMQHSYYDRPGSIIPGRVKGYAQTPAGYQNAAYISMTLPYAAGSLASSVDDMAVWDAAIADSDKLINEESRRRMTTSYALPDGAAVSVPYGLGVGLQPRRGEPRVGHNGQINGFTTMALRLPKDHVYVAVLTNLENPKLIPDLIAERVAAIAAGKPYPEQATVTLTPQALDHLVGSYTMDAKNVRIVSREGNRLFMQRNAGRKLELLPVSDRQFVIQDAFNEVSFAADASGKITTLSMTQVYGPASVATRSGQ